MSLLADMAASSRERCEAGRARRSLADLRAAARHLPAPPRLVLDGFDLIAEVKLVAPSAGTLAAPTARGPWINAQADAYARGGAAAISVLTEPLRFGGELADLEAVARRHVAMRKDFLVDPWQLWEARVAGASGALLIVRMLDDATLGAMLDVAEEAGLWTLLEAFDEDDLARVTALVGPEPRGTCLVGVNTRDLVTLQVDPERLARLVPHLPPGLPAVAESGIVTAADAAAVARLGYRLALVGTALMRSADPEALVTSMRAAGRAAWR